MTKSTAKINKNSRKKNRASSGPPASKGQSIIVCGQPVEIGTEVVLWNDAGGFACPNPRGRSGCAQHDPVLNDQPTRPLNKYTIISPADAYEELKQSVYQFILHYDVCYSSHHCHQVIKESTFKGSHFYLDLDGAIYQTCDLYWKTNTAPADDRIGNERSVHVEIANLSWQALASESDLYQARQDMYRKQNNKWKLTLPEKYKNKLRSPRFVPVAARSWGKRGYFSRNINGRRVRMWDFTEEQYRALILLCKGINRALPKVKPRVPFDQKSKRTPLGKIKNFSTFAGILGHAHVQGGTTGGIKKKYDPGSAFDWGRLRRTLSK